MTTTTSAATFTRSWPTAAAWGAGLIAAALGAAAIVSADATVVSRGIGVLLFTLGLGVLAWGAVSLSRVRVVAPRATLAAVLISVVAMVALLIAAPARTSVFAVAVGIALLVPVGAVNAVAVRRGPRAERQDSRVGMIGLLVAAAIIAVLVTPALAATQDAALLTDDGTVPVIDHGGH